MHPLRAGGGDVTTRIVVLLAVLGLAFALVWFSERWRGRARIGLEPGLMLVTAHGCSMCGPAERALAGAGLSFRSVDASEVRHLGVRSVPTLFVVDEWGEVVLRRSGRAAVVSPAELAVWS